MGKNYNYISGRRFEYQLREKFEKEGAKVIRAAGSKGSADLAVYWPTGSNWVVQLKKHNGKTGFSEEKRKFVKDWEKFAVIPVWATKTDGKIRIEHAENGLELKVCSCCGARFFHDRCELCAWERSADKWICVIHEKTV